MSIQAAIKKMQSPGGQETVETSTHTTRASASPSAAQSGPPGTWTNFARIGSCTPAHEHYPTTVDEVVELVKRIGASGGKCRVAGAGKSPNTCTFTTDHLIHMDRMNKILAIDVKARTITCQGGASMEHVLRTLDASDLMLLCVPSFVKTTVAGCIGTATHSSGLNTTSLSDYVTRVVLVDASGVVRTFAKNDASGKDLSFVACHLGALGVVVEVTLQTEARSLWHLRSSPLSLFEACDAVKMAKKVRDNEYYRFWWVPHTNQCYESFGRRVNVDKAGADKYAFEAWRAKQKTVKVKLDTAVKGNWLRHNVVEKSLHVARNRPSLQPCINKAYARTFYGAPSEQYGSTMECFTFDCLFKQWANEWAIPIEHAADALMLLREMIEKQKLRVHFPVELRFCAADTTAMSPAVDRKTCWIGVVMYRPYLDEARDTKAYYDGFNAIVQRLGGRPHWAKYYAWCNEDVQSAYGQHWTDFLAFRKKMDPNNMFVNPWLANLMASGPQRVNTTVFSPPSSSLAPVKSKL